MNKEFKPGMSFHAVIPFSEPKSIKVHIDHVIPSFYNDGMLIVYRVFGKRKRWWHEFMCSCEQMKNYRLNAKRHDHEHLDK